MLKSQTAVFRLPKRKTLATKDATHLVHRAWQSYRRSVGLILLFLLLITWLVAQTVYAATTVTVNDVGDASDLLPGDDICDAANAVGEQCTLRAAIEELNAQGADSTPHQIHFNIPGNGPHRIEPATGLPNISVPMIIDGSTQPGATCPTADQPANLQIVLDGVNDTYIASRGFWFLGNSAGSEVRGLVIGNFYTGIWLTANGNQVECSHIGVAADGVTPMPNSKGIQITSGDNNIIGGADDDAQRNVISANSLVGVDASVSFADGNNLIANNLIGTTADGLSPLGNGNGVILQQVAASGVGNLLGGTLPLSRNVIGGNTQYGVNIFGGEAHQVLGNYIGVGVDGVTAVPNKWDGVLLGFQAANSRVGGLAPGEANLIAYNGDSGIAVYDYVETVGNTLRGNVLFGNGRLGIDNGLDDVDENDVLDVDEGGNGRLNYPTITTASPTGQFIGSYSGAANQTFTLDFYSSTECHKQGHGEAETYLGSIDVTTDANGVAAFDVTFSPLTLSHSVSATATDADGSTSEFSACAFVGGVPPSSLPLSLVTNCVAATAPPTVGSEAIYLPLVVAGNSPQPSAAKISAANSTLSDGGVVTGVDGVSIGAIAGSLPTSIDVTISATTAPTPTIIADPTVHGSYYHVAANQDVAICGQEQGLILGLPVPTGVATTNLAIAILPEGDTEWRLVSGLYDDVSELMLVRLSGLSQTGLTVVLVELAGFSSVPLGAKAGNAVGVETAVSPQAPQAATIYVDCYSNNANGCPGAAQFADFLQLVLTEMTDMGYPEPELACKYGELKLAPGISECIQDSYVVSLAGTEFNLENCALNDEPSGFYFRQVSSYREQLLGICPTISYTNLFNTDKRAIRYHYFQATQYGWPEHVKTWSDWLNGNVRYQYNDWVVASTAAAAMISIPTEMESSNDYARRPVDVALDSDEPPYKYQAQDFWVYIGKSLDVGLTMLEPLFEQYGSTTDAVVDWAGGRTNFQDLYWNWVQNQTMLEDDILLNEDDIGTACTFQENSVETLESVHYTHLAGISFYDPILQPLTSRVYKFTIDANLAPAILGVGDNRLRDEVRAKIYVDGGAGCELIEDGDRHFSYDEWADIIANGSDIYIVVSNTDHENEQEFSIWVEAGGFSPPTP